ncbi:hypothetical protein AXF42_Ash007107 [Apostasia shenzhenica]|uniref:UBX domain-containing protein n=1 Tax=Apostasia shenzhenica TaxID=1088818 RepID=A0A2I0BF43_9ASPA|nr:hypothetical protein AXF42_Ash007107 [Apostasia shenzhenica]
MTRPSQDAIDTFMSITGVTEAVALQKLEQFNGDLNEAVNAHFNEGDRLSSGTVSAPTPRDDFMDIDDSNDAETAAPTPSLLSGSQRWSPFSIFDRHLGQSMFDGGTTDFMSRVPRVSHPRDVRQIPIDFKDENPTQGTSTQGPRIEDVTGRDSEHGPEVHGTVDIEDDDDVFPSAPSTDVSFGRHPGPSIVPSNDYTIDIEEEMIQAAIEASKREVENLAGPKVDRDSPVLEDSDIAHAVSLSLKTAEQESAAREHGTSALEQCSNSSGSRLEDSGRATAASGRLPGLFPTKPSATSYQDTLQLNAELALAAYCCGALAASVVSCEAPLQLAYLHNLERDPSFDEEVEDVDEEPLVRHHSRNPASETAAQQVVGSPQSLESGHHAQGNGDVFQSDEWGGISSQEHDEAVMLEAAMFGGIPERSAYRFPYPHHQGASSEFDRAPRPASPRLVEQRMLREQQVIHQLANKFIGVLAVYFTIDRRANLQDDAYLASLQADREKELNAVRVAEERRLEEAAAREAALERRKHQEEEALIKKLEEEEFERKLAAKQSSLPEEPPVGDENSVTLLIRMPDGSRCGRRFLKSHTLQLIYDYIDVGRLVKPGSYRLVRPYPRHAFTDEESQSSLSDLGLTSKQEALFLELI